MLKRVNNPQKIKKKDTLQIIDQKSTQQRKQKKQVNLQTGIH